MRSFFFFFFIPTIQQGKLPPVTRETCARWVRQSRYSTVTCYWSKQKSHCVGRGLGVGKGKAREVGQGGGQGRTLAEPTACGLNACPWVCAGALWELCCDRLLGALGRFPPVFPPVALKSTCRNDSLHLRDKGDKVIFYLEYVPSSAGIQRLSATIRLAKPWSDLLRRKDWHFRVITHTPKKGQELEKNEIRHPRPQPRIFSVVFAPYAAFA